MQSNPPPETALGEDFVGPFGRSWKGLALLAVLAVIFVLLVVTVLNSLDDQAPSSSPRASVATSQSHA